MREVLGAFDGRLLRRFFDGTLGGGGHAAALLRAHPELELYLATDLDPAAHSVAEAALASASVPLVVRRGSDPEGGYLPTKAGTPRQSAQVLHGSFLAGAQALAAAEWTVDGALLDLGMSSMQLDAAGRGFAFGRDGPLDMRMDPGGALAASDIVNGWSERDLGALIREYGEEPRWRALAQRIVAHREAEGPIISTAALAALLGGGSFRNKKPLARGKKRATRSPATQTFQALRIAVNGELRCLEAALPLLIDRLSPGGRLAVISFHSLEDRIVKRAFRAAAGEPLLGWEPEALGGGTPRWLLHAQRDSAAKVAKILTKKPLVPLADEVDANPRARSAKLRILEKL
ncbi:hypothetical protein QBZ16_003909 [Prototheca wickerhamii]|uniref:Uncharacterized protein n=1 Tax=Prototheca wickerhamii TaxID=3111 RepID=A0AAD9IHZ8_PROWI|nr:hypothetical protein QBZ16_003909 [Prototheca wickerhamii]